ncbi:DUF5689 domain-containing protein [Pedobacter nyackensis]|uniref:DUF5689 domain-containing protein n=1 Tax=Pedobacter nyackensis TaxID=475255 RepID=UPI00292D4E07|nr:DUF5689 domain-containing protein [Pedobacter nyackensis]
MKKIYLFLIATILTGTFLSSCKKDPNNALGTVNPFAAMYVVKKAYKGTDVKLGPDNLEGANSTGGVVISDSQKGNIPKGTVVVQNTARGFTRGLIIELGNVDVPFVPGDSVTINLSGSTLANVNGSLRLKGISLNAINKVASGKAQKMLTVPSNLIIAKPMDYEGTLVTVTNATFNPAPAAGEIYAGNKTINDGFGDLTLHTEATADYANEVMPEGVTVVGLVFAGGEGSNHQIWPRTKDDIVPLRSLEASPILITGFLTNPDGDDFNQEYIQLMATEAIDFAINPFSVVTTNNAGSNIPTGAPVNGWATGNQRTYKFDLTSGTVAKGEFFYVGATSKLINGAGSTDISNAKWMRNIAYNTVEGDGLGSISTNLLANSGNPGGIAVFRTTTVTATSVPIDVLFWGTASNGAVYSAGPPPIGYRITNTDYYDMLNPISQAEQPMFTQGSNTGRLGFPAAASFAKLGGIYNVTTGRWSVGRTLTNVTLNKTTPLTAIETGTGFTTIEQ